ncbi:MAG: hypothetical protein LBG59_06180 [Candidatus Peribacteria bacterium]|jgi:regulator of replication initiation timing|nr:hypothetical protein [Candidatus Peribacteria bacterium]
MIEIARLEQQISSIDVRKIEQLKQKKRKLYEEQTALETGSKQFRSNYSTTISSLSSYIPSELRKKVPNTIEELSAIITLIQTLKEY